MWIVIVEREDDFFFGPFSTREDAQGFIDSAYDDADEVYATDNPEQVHLGTADVESARIAYMNEVR